MIYLKSVIKINMETQNISPEKLEKFKNTADNAIAFIYNMYHLLFCRQLKKKTNMHLLFTASKVFPFLGIC